MDLLTYCHETSRLHSEFDKDDSKKKLNKKLAKLGYPAWVDIFEGYVRITFRSNFKIITPQTLRNLEEITRLEFNAITVDSIGQLSIDLR